MQQRRNVGDNLLLPDGAVCETCGKIIAEFPGVGDVLKAHGIGAVIGRTVRCLCDNMAPTRTAAQRLHAFAGLPFRAEPKTFDNFRPRPGTEGAIGAARSFGDEQGGFHVLVLVGPTGSGKSHLLEAIGNRAIEREQVVKYEYVPTLLDKLRASYRADPPTDVLGSYEIAQTVLLDDMGVEKGSEWVTEKLTTLVDSRYREGRRLAIATNLTYEEIEERCGSRLASRMYDSATGAVKRITIDASDYREA